MNTVTASISYLRRIFHERGCPANVKLVSVCFPRFLNATLDSQELNIFAINQCWTLVSPSVAHIPTRLQCWFDPLVKAHLAQLVDYSTKYRSWSSFAFRSGLVATTNVWHVRECHTGPTFQHWWILVQITLHCVDDKTNEYQSVTRRCRFASDSVSVTDFCKPYAFPMRCKWSLTISLETWHRLASSLQVFVIVHLSRYSQGLIIHNLWSVTVGFG